MACITNVGHTGMKKIMVVDGAHENAILCKIVLACFAKMRCESDSHTSFVCKWPYLYTIFIPYLSFETNKHTMHSHCACQSLAHVNDCKQTPPWNFLHGIEFLQIYNKKFSTKVWGIKGIRWSFIVTLLSALELDLLGW